MLQLPKSPQEDDPWRLTFKPGIAQTWGGAGVSAGNEANLAPDSGGSSVPCSHLWDEPSKRAGLLCDSSHNLHRVAPGSHPGRNTSK